MSCASAMELVNFFGLLWKFICFFAFAGFQTQDDLGQRCPIAVSSEEKTLGWVTQRVKALSLLASVWQYVIFSSVLWFCLFGLFVCFGSVFCLSLIEWPLSHRLFFSHRHLLETKSLGRTRDVICLVFSFVLICLIWSLMVADRFVSFCFGLIWSLCFWICFDCVKICFGLAVVFALCSF